MTKGTCSPYAPPFIADNEDAQQVMNAAYMSEAGQEYIRKRGGWDPEAIKQIRATLANMLPLNFEELDTYFKKQGWMNAAGKPATFKDEEIGYMAAVTKNYLESRAGGIQQMADNFIAKTSAGQMAIPEGLQLARQMMGLSKFVGIVAGADQTMGRALRLQMLRNADEASALKWGRQALESMDGIEEAEKYRNIFEDIAAKLSGGNFDEGINDLIVLAKRIQMSDNPAEVVRPLKDINLHAKMFDEVWINGLLSSPGTIAINATSFTWALARPMFQYGAAQLMSPLMPETAGRAAAEAAASLTTMYSSMSDGLMVGWKALQRERETYRRVSGGAGLENKSKAITFDNINASFGGKIPDAYEQNINTIGEWVRLPSRLAMAGDQFTKHLAVRGEISANAIKSMAKDGVDLRDKAKVSEYLDLELNKALFNRGTPEERLNASYDYYSQVLSEADTVTFQEENSLARGITSVLDKAPYLRPFMPFVRTPLNIMRQGFLESTGIGALIKGGQIAMADPTKAIFNIQEELMKDPGESFRLSGQIAFTGALLGTIYMQAQAGNITGGGPGRWSQGGMTGPAQLAWGRAMDAQGRVPYSVRIGDQSIPFDRFGEPLAIVMRMAADMGMYADYATQVEQDEIFSGVASIALTGLYNASFLKGINDITDVLKADGSNFNRKAGATVQNYMATFTPFGGFLNYIDKVQDPYRHTYQGKTFTEMLKVHEDAFGTGIFGKMMDRIPGAGNTPLMIDQLTGEPVPHMPGGGPAGLNPLQMAIPFMPRGIPAADDVWNKVYEISGGYTERRPSKDFIQLTREEQQQMNARMARVRLNGMNVSQAINAFYARPDVQNYVANKAGLLANVKTKIEREFDELLNDYKTSALEEMISSDRQLLRRRALTIDAKTKENANDFAGAKASRDQIHELLQFAGSGLSR